MIAQKERRPYQLITPHVQPQHHYTKFSLNRVEFDLYKEMYTIRQKTLTEERSLQDTSRIFLIFLVISLSYLVRVFNGTYVNVCVCFSCFIDIKFLKYSLVVNNSHMKI